MTCYNSYKPDNLASDEEIISSGFLDTKINIWEQ